LPGDPSAPPAFAVGPPAAALVGFWRRLAAAFLDWILIGIVAAAIGELFGVEVPSPPSTGGNDVNLLFQPAPGPFILVELAYFTYFHATSPGQSIGNKILGIRVLDADTGRLLPYARAFVRALMSSLSALPFFLGFFWMLWDPASGPGTISSPTAWSSGPPSTHRASSPRADPEGCERGVRTPMGCPTGTKLPTRCAGWCSPWDALLFSRSPTRSRWWRRIAAARVPQIAPTGSGSAAGRCVNSRWQRRRWA
jgi:uncharacterized RDD family membrane protein YckC